jgi:hypothetical protein
MMNIYAKNGDKVRFINKNGYDGQPDAARKAGLVEGSIYTVKEVDIGCSHSYVYLKEFPGTQSFNTVMFEDVI